MSKNKITGIICLVVIGLAAGFTPATVIVYQDGADNALVTGYTGTQDVTLHQAQDGVNLNGDAHVRTGVANGGMLRGMFKFDLSSLAGQYSAINAITFTYYNDSSYTSVGSNNSYGSAWFNVQKTANAAWDETKACWWALDYSGTTVEWAGGLGSGAGLAGTDYFVDKIAEWDYPRYQVPGMPDYVSVTITGGTGFTLMELVDLWSGSQASNAGFSVGSNTQGSTYALDYLHINSSECSTQAWRPSLTIDYTPIPEPVTLALLGIGGVVALLKRRR